MNEKIVYRRIHGRIVPIKVKEDVSQTKKTGGRMMAAAAAGTFLAAEGSGRIGMLAKKEFRKTSIFTQKAAKFIGSNNEFSEAALKRAAKHLKHGKKLALGAKTLGYGASFIGTSMFAEGISRRMFPESQTKQAVTSTVIGIPLFFGINKIIKKRAFPFLK